MRELSLHILDIFENATRAGATQVTFIIELDKEEKWLSLCIEDNGCGLSVTPEQALDPFYTTKTGKRTGLGLSLFKAAAEQAGGNFQLSKSASGGVAVRATFQFHHVDRMPIGDLAETFLAILISSPDLHLVCSFAGPNGAFSLCSRDTDVNLSQYKRAKIFSEQCREALRAVGIQE